MSNITNTNTDTKTNTNMHRMEKVCTHHDLLQPLVLVGQLVKLESENLFSGATLTSVGKNINCRDEIQ